MPSSSAEPVSIALLGAGIFAKEAYLPALKHLSASIRLVAVYSRSRRSATDTADAAKTILQLDSAPNVFCDEDQGQGIEHLLSQPGIKAVIIALPISLQPRFIVKCLEAGKHVLSEKPVGKDVHSGLDLIALYEEQFRSKSLVWRVAENYETEPGVRRAAQIIRGGQIGDVRFFRLTSVGHVGLDSKWYKTPWRTVPDYEGGFLLDGGVHSAALLRVVLPDPIRQVTAFASLSRSHLAPHDTITALLSCTPASEKDSAPKDKKAHGIFELSFAGPAPSRADKSTGNGIIITGTKGWMQIEMNVKVNGTTHVRTTTHLVKKSQETESDKIEEAIEVSEDPQSGIECEVQSFLNAIQGDDDGLGSPKNALLDVQVIEASLKSEGRVIEIGFD